MSRTKQQIVWGFVRRNGPTRTQQIMDAKQMSRRTVNAVMRQLKRKGCLVSVGSTHAVVYHATDVRPDDLRGTAPGSVAAALALAKARRRPDKHKHRPMVTSGTALDQCWPSPVAQTI